ncbi:MAG: HlyD family efflux transporter periplasmic adaptor subunit [Planctomycetaceae bacterium]|nr:HlyD family efflux transporter periplasmic adaptor subunit [Planctomycetaceae bacterium]
MDPQDRRSSRRRAQTIFLATTAGAVVLLGWKLGLPLLEGRGHADDRSPTTARPIARPEVRALARLEPASGLVVVGAQPGARIEQVLVAEGQAVAAGAALAVLEGHAQREQELAVADAQKKAAEFRRQLRRDELKLERERFDRLKQTRLDNLRSLVAYLRSKVQGEGKDARPAESGPSLVPGQAVAREIASGQYKTELSRSEIELKELETSLELLDRQRALEDREVAEDSPESQVLDRQVALANAALDQTVVRAPIAGKVLQVAAHQGEVSSGPLLFLGDVGTMVARAEVFQSDVLDVEVGAPAEVTILGRTVGGKVTRVGSVVARNKINSLDPTTPVDRRVVEVIVQIDDPAPASRLVDMQVDVAIRRQARDSGAR